MENVKRVRDMKLCFDIDRPIHLSYSATVYCISDLRPGYIISQTHSLPIYSDLDWEEIVSCDSLQEPMAENADNSRKN